MKEVGAEGGMGYLNPKCYEDAVLHSANLVPISLGFLIWKMGTFLPVPRLGGFKEMTLMVVRNPSLPGISEVELTIPPTHTLGSCGQGCWVLCHHPRSL